MSIVIKKFDLPIHLYLDYSSDDDEEVDSKTYDHPLIHIPNVDSDIEAAVNKFLRKCESSDDAEVRLDAKDDLRSYIEQKEMPMSMLLELCNFVFEIENSDLMGVFSEKFGDVIRAMKPEEVEEVCKLMANST